MSTKEALKLAADTGSSITRGSNYDGAMFFIEKGGELTIDGIVVDGGGENLTGDSKASIIANHGSLTVDNCELVNGVLFSNSQNINGGALYNTGSAQISNTLLEGCYAANGGAVYNSGNLSLTDCAVRGNAAGTEGGAIYSSGSLDLADVRVTGNKCGNIYNTGGIFNTGSMKISGDICVSSNTNSNGDSRNLANESNNPIIISDQLGNSSMIGISSPDEANSVIAQGDGTKVRDAAKYTANFFPDSSNKAIVGETNVVKFGSGNATYIAVNIEADENGSVTPAGTIRMPKNGTVTITVTPNAGYEIKDLKVENSSVLTDAKINSSSKVATYELKGVTKSVDVHATFERTSDSVVEALASTGGSINPSGNQYVNSDSTVVYTITPSSGSANSLLDDYYLESLKLDGKDVLESAVKNKDGS